MYIHKTHSAVKKHKLKELCKGDDCPLTEHGEAGVRRWRGALPLPASSPSFSSSASDVHVAVANSSYLVHGVRTLLLLLLLLVLVLVPVTVDQPVGRGADLLPLVGRGGDGLCVHGGQMLSTNKKQLRTPKINLVCQQCCQGFFLEQKQKVPRKPTDNTRRYVWFEK